MITLVCVAHTLYYLHNVKSLTGFLDGHKVFIENNPKITGPYKKGVVFGQLVAVFFKIKSLIPAIIGVSILFGEFNYAALFKPLFIAGEVWGKIFYSLVLVFLFAVVFLMIGVLLPEVDKNLNTDIGMAMFLMISSFVYAVGKYASQSYKQLRTLNYEKTKAELTALKAQINPHFLFNILNNLYGTAIVEDSPKTADGIQQLSRIMRHVVEETKTKRSPVEKEIEFINDYLKLQKMRVPNRENISITESIEWDGIPNQVAPLLFIPYIENAFKYGISVNEPCFIKIGIDIKDGLFNFSCENSVMKSSDKLEKGTSTGLENTAKRLSLYYPGRHKIEVTNEDGVFSVKAKVKL